MDTVVKSMENSSIAVKNVIVHPLALLSALDHFFRDATHTPEPEEQFGRVVGVLPGSSFKGTVQVSNSYGVPFEENEDNPSV
ncbi:hypothetical protein QN277_023497 [Acacia crassicarpa]|uniref:MPN domain-containing protein n=1 Tax=Acacia crassicarpa TaxID=499986 RepID=A0AAE1MRP4_9FABA|nr:hypothetical protein QN277_023497 [Acacia crassicarpa]